MGAFFTSVAALALLMMPLSQARDRASAPGPAAVSDAATLAAGWNALAAGQPVTAAREAAKILARTPWHHAALTLRIEALSAGDPVRGLDAYEQWLANRSREDAALLEPAARAFLRQIAGSSDAD